ncbi:unnamed protein product [Callosobruchus maculatus]|uniref:Uncharacterized protein n=1 Tax=Callosobruchus maculatus TaxID=64391 RepID=A0A653BHY9_CALMS|nr:unnamed protein product [Callosobruchus maculatus]
MLLTFVVP